LRFRPASGESEPRDHCAPEEQRRGLWGRLESRISPEDAFAAIRERRDEGKLATVIQIDPGVHADHRGAGQAVAGFDHSVRDQIRPREDAFASAVEACGKRCPDC
jgi:hypothetical protein